MKSNLGFGFTFGAIGLVIAIFLGIAMISGFERLPVQTAQGGYRGTGIDEIYNPRTLARLHAANIIPASLPQLPAAGPKAGAVYKNVKVLGDLSVGEFTRLMASITTWVAPTQGCAYCHNTANMADDGLYTKIVARRMIQMTQHVNADWKTHVAATGVTCFTCHRGNPVPTQTWFSAQDKTHGSLQADPGKNLVAPAAGDSSLPGDPFTPFLKNAANIRVQATTALPQGDSATIKNTDWTYALMMHMSSALGVNCTYCHNTRSFGDWSQSTPQRVTAWYGIRMVRDLNSDYLGPLTPTFPPARRGPSGDVAKINCATCHQGVYKPLFGVSMVASFPELQAPSGGH
jgi:photosynthetic reaction center cytochrome c subunit